MTRNRCLVWIAAATLATASLAACGADDSSGSAPMPTDGGGGMQAGAPSFQSFTVSPSVQCENRNAEAHMSFSTLNVVDIEIKIGSGKFAGTADYGPNESDVIASIPCSGAGTSSVQLRGCTEDHTCADSAAQPVEITA